MKRTDTRLNHSCLRPIGDYVGLCRTTQYRCCNSSKATLSDPVEKRMCLSKSELAGDVETHAAEGEHIKQYNNMEQIVRPHCAHAKKHNCDANIVASATRPEHLAYFIPCLHRQITWHKFRYHLLEIRSRSQRPLHHSNHRTQMMMEP